MLYPELLAEKLNKAREVLGVHIDTSETSFLGKLLRNQAWDEAYFWEKMEDTYYSPFVNASEGTDLDNVGMYLTITRRPSVKSKGIITIVGTKGTVIEKGFRVSTENGVMFETTETVTISGESGSADIPIISIGAGKGNNVGEKTIVKIVNPQMGVGSVINNEQTEGGLDIETDDEFRTRYHKSYSRGGGSTMPAIMAALLDIPSIVDADVIENDTMEVIDGIPRKSVASYVFGATSDEEIAQTIFQNKAGGIQAFGEIYIPVEDSKGRIHQIGFTRAKVQDIYVKVIITKDEGYKGDEIVKRVIINYIGGIDDDGIEYYGLKLGGNVILSRTMGVIMCLGGVADVQVLLSLDGVNYKDTNIEIAKNTIARTSPDKVVIEYA